ncbi:glycosyltransferase family 2 protein [Pleurocapsa sp. PCC 7319]|uniref:glycosyltransferase family 2 protein n=1 Tax=Pleurocapsa sp. PCC 7319 TaxID=118161 RepID=UPI000344DB21|nr:glycosyltransferase family 2 protein [Pleurocapsa sp. PCC 7319]
MSQNQKNNNLKLAVLMTCHNRSHVTLKCLKALYRQNKSFQVYLVDDGSSDGTSEAVKNHYPDVKILLGNGNLFWVGGMYFAFAEAMKHNYEYYLWLNDDTILEPDALSKLLDTHTLLTSQNKTKSIVVGSVKDPASGEYSYGGRIRSRKKLSHTFEAIKPGKEPQECLTMQGNIVLIPRSVANIVGNLESNFTHQRGDLDYGLRAKKLGCSIFVAPGYLGSCPQNSVTGSWIDMNLSPYQRLKKAFHIKAFPPKEWTIFIKRHSGDFWFIYWSFPYIRALIGYRNLDYSPTFKRETKADI